MVFDRIHVHSEFCMQRMQASCALPFRPHPTILVRQSVMNLYCNDGAAHARIHSRHPNLLKRDLPSGTCFPTHESHLMRCTFSLTTTVRSPTPKHARGVRWSATTITRTTNMMRHSLKNDKIDSKTNTPQLPSFMLYEWQVN